MRKTAVVASLCRSVEDERVLREMIEAELGPEKEMVDVLVSHSKDEYFSFLKKADVLFSYKLPTDQKAFLDKATRLKWVHLAAAGVDSSMSDAVSRHNFKLTNSRGMHARRVAEYVMGAVISYSKGFIKALKSQQARRWARSELIAVNRTLAGKTLGILGLGALGKQIARVAHPFGLDVIALRRDPGVHPKPKEVRRVFGPQNLREFIHPLDFLVICVPLTEETYHLIDREELVRLKTSALVVNVSRGAVIDEQALVESLRDGEIGGAVLDVFEEEPLSEDSPLWDMENVFITPHVAGTWAGYLRDASRVFARNLRLFLEKRPLDNIIDKRRGY